jgi:hypothetical protein
MSNPHLPVRVLALALLGLFLAACTSIVSVPAAPAPPTITPQAGTAPNPAIPNWMLKVVQKIRSQPRLSRPAYISRYQYHGQMVYYLPPGEIAATSVVYDSEGEVICRSDGGKDNRGDGSCPDFVTGRTDGVTIWIDVRP